MMRRLPLLLLPLLVLAGCGGRDEPSAGTTPSSTSSPSSSATASDSTPPTASPSPSPSGPPKVIGTVAKGLEVPWGIAFLPDRTALVTERDSGRVYRIGNGKVTRIGQVAQARANNEAGLLGVAVSPTYATDHRVFFYASTDSDNRVLRTTYAGGRLGAMTPIVTGIPLGGNHDGGRMIFGPDGRLYVSTGESGQPDLAQDKSSLGGKILRVTQDGDPAPGNPFPGSRIWSYGHRNVQGLAFVGKQLWASEFGQDTWDELNRIEAGKNYGWPAQEGRGNSGGGEPKYVDPQVQWHTDDASPSGLAYLDGRLWLGALHGARLWRVDVNGDKAGADKAFFIGKYGRMRTVVAAPDGNLWVTTSNRDGRGDPAADDDRILLVRP
jgi:glucose/arabinose dehydrogenase